MLTLQLARYNRPVRLRLLAPARLHAGGAIKSRFQLRVADLRGNRPGKAGTLKAGEHVPHRRTCHSRQAGNLSHRKASLAVHSHHFAQCTHLRPPRRHPSLQTKAQRLAPKRSGSKPPEGWAGINRNGGRDQFGIPGGNSSEWWAASIRNPHPYLVLPLLQLRHANLSPRHQPCDQHS